jgi:hypothetical protein
MPQEDMGGDAHGTRRHGQGCPCHKETWAGTPMPRGDMGRDAHATRGHGQGCPSHKGTWAGMPKPQEDMGRDAHATRGHGQGCPCHKGTWAGMPMPLALGVICGLGIATKLTFFPIILISAVCCRRALLPFAAALIGTVVVVLIPIYPELPRLAEWTAGIVTQSGLYGTGETGLPHFGTYVAYLIMLVVGEPLVVVIPVVAMCAVAVARASSPVTLRATGFQPVRKRFPSEVAYAAIPMGETPMPRRIMGGTPMLLLFLAQVVAFLAIGKHANYHYLIPLCLSTGLNLALLGQVAQRGPDLARLLSVIALVFLLFLGFSSFKSRLPALYADLDRARIQQLDFYERVKEQTRNAQRVDYYRSGSPEFALYFGNFYARRAFADLLAKRFPNALFYNIFFGRFETFATDVEPAAVRARYDRLYFYGNSMTRISSYGRVYSFEPQNAKLLEQAGDYLLQEWVRR